jgi:hypothetical protein
MRLARSILCASAIVIAVGATNVTMATAGAPTHTESFVTCATPVTVAGAVEISSARAERGTALTPSVPGETCTVTQ